MPRFTMRASGGGYAIKQGRRLVGNVRHAACGILWVGRIGAHTASAETADMAFREVAARALGFTSAYALAEHNRRVRADNNAARRRMRAMMPARSARPVRVFGPVEDEPFSD